MKILSKGTIVKDTSLRLIFFYSKDSITFLSDQFDDTVIDNSWSQWIWSWLLVRNLHPVRTQDVNFRSVSESDIFHWSFPVFGFGINGYNSLVLRNNLHHSLRITVMLSENGVSIIWIIENSHIAWYVLLVSIVLTSFRLLNFIWSWNKLFLATNVIFNIGKDFRIVVIVLFIFRNLKLLF